MATIQLGNTKVANRLISYVEKRAEVREGVDCPAEYAKAQMKATRELWGKNDGIQAHHIIQSFKPGEVTPELANQIGQDLAREIAKGHECVVYTHTDKDHIHNHIVINSVSYENGRKFHAHGKKAIDRVREVNDRLCQERNLSVIREPSAQQRYARAEYGLAKRGIMSWKDELREVIDYERRNSRSYDEFKKNLTQKYGIEVKERGKNISFRHPDAKKFVRGKTLGLAYERGTLEDGFNRQIERESSQERGNADVSNVTRAEHERTHGHDERNARAEQLDEKLHQSSHGQSNSREIDAGQRNRKYQNNQQTGDRSNAFDIDEARKTLEQQRRSVAKGFERVLQRDEREQSADSSKDGADRRPSQQGNERNQESSANRHQQHDRERAKQNEPIRIRQSSLDLER